jgi:hypothetical protein
VVVEIGSAKCEALGAALAQVYREKSTDKLR